MTEPPLIVQTDRTVLLETQHPSYEVARDRLARFAELEKSPEYVHFYRITPISIWNAAALGLTGLWGFQYATTCSQARVNAFGGGAHVLDLATGETVDWIYTDGWLDQTLSDEGGPL